MLRGSYLHLGGLFICPRCGEPATYIRLKKIGSHIYVYVLHYKPRHNALRGLRRGYRYCYIGSYEETLLRYPELSRALVVAYSNTARTRES